MKAAELEKLINILGQIKDLKESHERDEEDDEDEGCELLDTLNDDFQKYQNWLWGNLEAKFSKKKALQRWRELHPELPMPRVLLSEKDVDPDLRNMAIMFDAYPHYLAETKKCCNK